MARKRHAPEIDGGGGVPDVERADTPPVWMHP